MAIISGSHLNQKEKLKIEINSELLETIVNYCKWSGIDDIDYFMEEAACFVFAKDKEWKAHQKSVKRARKNKSAASA